MRSDLNEIELVLSGWFPNSFVRTAQIAEYPILPEEMAFIEKAVQQRKHEFATGRWLSRQGLRNFGLEDSCIGIGPLRNPLWPDSVIGTITHDSDCCAVVIEKKSLLGPKGIGIDLVALNARAEKMPNLLPIVMMHQNELESLKFLNIDVDPSLLLFSVKESVVKALNFKLNKYVDMRQIEIIYSNSLQFKFLNFALRHFATALCLN
jgi:4'-phosphopantetheinyl transferase EntD